MMIIINIIYHHMYVGYLQLGYTPETNHVSRVYSVAAILYLQCMLHVMLFHVSELCMCAMSNMAVFLSLYFFMSCFPGMLLRYFLNDLEMVPVIAIVTGIIFAFTSSSST